MSQPSAKQLAERWLKESAKEGHTYPDAGKKSQPEIQEAIKRFLDMSEEDRAEAGPLWSWLLGEGTPAFKIAKEDANYKTEPEGEQKCGNCMAMWLHRATGVGICDQLRGVVKDEHWCNRWEASWDRERVEEYQR